MQQQSEWMQQSVQSIDEMLRLAQEVNQELDNFVVKNQGYLSDTKSKIYRINLDLKQFQIGYCQKKPGSQNLDDQVVSQLERNNRFCQNLGTIQENFNMIMVQIDVNRKLIKQEEFKAYILGYIRQNEEFLFQDLEFVENVCAVTLQMEKFSKDKKYDMVEQSSPNTQKLSKKESFEYALYNPLASFNEGRAKTQSYSQNMSFLSQGLDSETNHSILSVFNQDNSNHNPVNGNQNSLLGPETSNFDQNYLDDYLFVNVKKIASTTQILVTFLNYNDQVFQKYKCSECQLYFQQVNLPTLASDAQSIISNGTVRQLCSQCFKKQNPSETPNFDKKLIYELMCEYVVCSCFCKGCSFRGTLGDYIYTHLQDDECEYQKVNKMGDDAQYIIKHKNLFTTIEEINPKHYENFFNHYTYIKQLQNRQIDKEIDGGQIKITTSDITFVTENHLQTDKPPKNKSSCQICLNHFNLLNKNNCRICSSLCCNNCSQVKIMGNRVCDVCLTMILQNLKGGDYLYFQSSAIEWSLQQSKRLMHIIEYIQLELIPKKSKELNEKRTLIYEAKKTRKDEITYQKLLIEQDKQQLLEDQKKNKETIDKEVDYIQLKIQRIEKKLLEKREELQSLENRKITEQNNQQIYEKAVKDLYTNPNLKKIPHYDSASQQDHDLLLKSLIVYNNQMVTNGINSKDTFDIEELFQRVLKQQDNLAPSVFQSAFNRSQIRHKQEKGNVEMDAKCQDCQIF